MVIVSLVVFYLNKAVGSALDHVGYFGKHSA